MDRSVQKGLLVLGGFMMGAGLGYIFADQKLKRYYILVANEEIESVKQTYKLLRKEPPYDKPETAVAAYLDRIDELQYMSEGGTIEEEEEEEKPKRELQPSAAVIDEDSSNTPYHKAYEPEKEDSSKVVNVFNQNFSKEEVEEVEEKESEVSPRIITVGEFMEDYHHYDKLTINYYEEDNVLVDERDQIIANVDQIVGRGVFDHFGDGSDDENVVYVRNDRLSSDFEILRNDTSYSEVVLGIPHKKRTDV